MDFYLLFQRSAASARADCIKVVMFEMFDWHGFIETFALLIVGGVGLSFWISVML